MSRTTIEIEMKTDNIDAVYNIIGNRLFMDGYQQRVLKGENVWAKGDGILIMLQCFNINFMPGKVIIQAWGKDLFLGESSLDNIMGWIFKGSMKGLLATIENEIRNSNL